MNQIELSKRINQAQLAKHFELSRSAVSQWFSKENGVPAERCPEIEAITGVKCEELRPDIKWDVLRKSGK
jgi:DNA-binding transcriptional regulator YdaS (Cro superfamily)